MQKTINILLLGSGMMAESVVTNLLKRTQNHIHIASNIIQDAQKIASKFNQNICSYSEVNVQDKESLQPLIIKSDIVVSYVPSFLHIHIARLCLQHSKNMVTASYISPEMNALDQQVKKKGLIFLNQLGLDPGIDHLATMKVVDEVAKSKGKIVQYESWCGGLPSPSCCDNPLGYKFTWSPIGALKALKNNAVFIQESKQVEIEAKDVLYHNNIIQLNQALSLEGYPNRNSVSYKSIYGLNDANKVLRGTLRYRGFCDIINAFKEIGLLNEDKVQGNTWCQYLEYLLKEVKGNNLQEKIKEKVIKIEKYEKIWEIQAKKKYLRIIKAFKYFGLLNPDCKIEVLGCSSLENLVKLLSLKLTLKEGQTDMIAMQHIFRIEYEHQTVIRKSSLIQIGERKGFSAMSLTVSTPTTIGVQLILDGLISERGVIRPIYPDIYQPVLAKLQEVGIKLFEIDQQV